MDISGKLLKYFNLSCQEGNKKKHFLFESMNKDEAIRCSRIAREAFQQGDFDKAKRLSNKSLSMYHTKEAEQLLNEIKSKENPTPEDQPTQNNKQTNEDTIQKETSNNFFSSFNKLGSLFNLEASKEEAAGENLQKCHRNFAKTYHSNRF